MTAAVAAEPGLARVINIRAARPGPCTYIGRGSEWGNPYSHRPSKYPDVIRVATRAEAIDRYRVWLWQRIQHEGAPLVAKLAALHGTTLGCYCSPKPCHGDVLARAAAWAARELRIADRTTNPARARAAA